MFDRGKGLPIIVIPGVQGRWEWMRPTLEELAQRCRTISYSLCGDAGSGRTIDPGLGFENYLRQVDAVLDEAGLERSAICGVSYGGLVALRYAATRPERVTALILVSSPAPGWTPTVQQQRWIARPWISTLPFIATSPGRLLPEIAAALPRWRGRMAFSARHVLRVVSAPIRPPLMASRITWTQQLDFGPDCAQVRAPTLVITGEEPLDRVVPVSVTRRYATLIAGARHETVERSGHIGLLTRPARFAALVCEFVNASSH
jgi:pimeloyl-ACP methyl ester carboxylesterase